MFTVSISNVKKIAPVGLFSQESKTYNHLVFDIDVSQDATIDNLPTIDYGVLHQFIDDALVVPSKLLETLLYRIVKSIESHYPDALFKVKITKMHPPLGGEPGAASVCWEK